MSESDGCEMASVMRKLQRRHGGTGQSKPKSNKRVKKDADEGCHETDPPAHGALHSETQPVGASTAHCDALQLDSETVKEDVKKEGSLKRDPAANAISQPESCSVNAMNCDALQLDSGSTLEKDDESLLTSSIVAARTQTHVHERPRMDNDDRTRRLPFGTFASGRSIYRNSLHPGETLQDGHVTISNLVLPGTKSALCTTFAGANPAWLETFLDGVDDLIVVCHDVRQQVKSGVEDMNSSGVEDMNSRGVEDIDSSPRVIGDAQVICMDQDQRPGWYILLMKPHTGGCLHAKLLLFRSELGLRVVVCGSNLYRTQWESDRDCLWVQDFICSTQYIDDDDDDDDSSTATNNSFEPCLRTFLKDLTKCRTERDQKLLATRLKDVFNGVNFETASARLVFSFPRPLTSKQSRGGWRLLAQSVYILLRKHTDDSQDFDSANHRAVPELVHAMAGSMGNIKPDFIIQMHEAMHGIDNPVSKKKKKKKTGMRVSVETAPHQDTDKITDTDWDQVEDLGLRCLWPSRQTALSMHFQSIIGSMRAIPLSFWKTIKEKAKRNIFFDASPNPTVMGLPHLACHPVSHAKVIIKTGGDGIGVVYVGSHNFSKSAWGLRGTMPRNLELGVVLVSQSTSLTQEWCSRLPCLLPEANAQSPSTYVPASAHTGILDAYREGRWIDAFQMLADMLKSAEDEQEPDLPCLLPEANAQSPSTYVPASAHTGILDAYREGRWIDAFQMLADMLKSAEDEQEPDLPCLLPEANAQSPSTYVPAAAHTGILDAYREGRWIDVFQILADMLKSAEDEQEPDAGAPEL
jgi:hypothetical protein